MRTVDIPFDEIVTESDQAVLFADDQEQFWVPKSLIEDIDEKNKVVQVAEWFAEKEGLI